MILNINRTPIQLTTYKDTKSEKEILNLLKICKENNSLNKISNIGGIQTAPVFLDIFVNLFKKDILKYLNSFKKKLDFKYKIVSGWLNENSPGDFNMPHSHDGGQVHFSGIWYLKCSPTSGGLIFLNKPNNSDFTMLFDFIDDPLSWVNYCIIPKQYQLVLFPSSLIHLVEPNRSDSNRISFAFNITLSK